MTPYEIQKDFVNEITHSSEIQNEYIAIYSELVYIRVLEVVQSTFPIYVSCISQNELEEQVKEFIKFGSKTAYVWKITFEFVDFLINKYGIKKVYQQMLIFEKEQIRIYVLNKDIRYKKKNNNRKYRLSKNVIIQKHDFDIVGRTLNPRKDSYYLIFKNIEDYDVYYISLSKFLFLFLKHLRNNNTLDKAIYLSSKQSKLKFKDAKEISASVIENWINIGVIV